jgi:NADH dehydrogenase
MRARLLRNDMAAHRPHVVVVGAGFAGIAAVRALSRADVDVTVIDRQNHHLFQPLLYQVATAALAAPDIAAPVRQIFRHQKNVTVLLDDVQSIDTASKAITCAHTGVLAYDHLVVATGSRHTYFDHPEWEANAPGLKTIDEAFQIRRRILTGFEAAERARTDDERRACLTFVVVGGGPTGVELAGAIGEIARKTMVQDFRRIDPSEARVILVERADRVLSTFSPELSQKAKAQLEELGVDVWLRTPVSAIDERGVTLGHDRLEARTVLWAAGVAGSPLGRALGVPLHRSGRVPVDDKLQIAGVKNVYVVGDLALVEQDGAPVPALAPAAMQMGRTVGTNIARQLLGQEPRSFLYVDKGSLATIGRRRAVGTIFGVQLSGFIAWLAWLFVHLMFLVGYRNRLSVLFDWTWAYLSYQRSARVIVGQGHPPVVERVEGEFKAPAPKDASARAAA